MLINMRAKFKNQKGFTLIELLVVIAIIGVLAAIAVPKFTNSTARANTAKIGADLAAIDDAIAMNQAQLNTDPATVAILATNGYLASAPNPPAIGAFYLTANAAAPVAVVGAAYVLTGVGTAMRATLDAHTSDYFH